MMNPCLYEMTGKTSIEDLEEMAKDKDLECVYSTGTCWWSLYKEEYMPYNTKDGGMGIPLDPTYGCTTYASTTVQVFRISKRECRALW